ncbi:MAG: ribonuclease J [Acholeplasmataceae bacterium]|jgi:ribonuclease J
MKNSLLKTDEIGVLALGGLGEVGKNLYVLDISNQLFIIDSGIMFPDAHLLGIDYVLPDFSFLEENQERIVGLFITHGHEDHIGGIPYLLRKVNIPKIYASGFAVSLLKSKLADFTDIKSPKIEEYESHSIYKFKDVEVSFVRLNHSIPDMHGIAFKTPLGYIFHTGDFKIDLTPVGPSAEYEKLSKMSEEGVLLLLSDSTNAERDEPIQSEKAIGESINELFFNIDGRIIIATFASNIYRMQQIIDASLLSNRQVAVVGRSMENAIEIGLKSGYIKAPENTFVDAEDINRIPPEKLTILCTGSQGEPLAVLSRIAGGSHRFIKAIPGDTVIFSSSPIPGNQEPINRTINALFRIGAEVITHGPLADTHTSGHGNQSDLKLMLSLTKPKFFIPVHGEHRMLKFHRDLAIDVGVNPNHILIMDNGDVAAISDNNIRLAGRVQAGDIYVDGTGIGDISNNVIRERKVLSEDGMFAVIITVDTSTRQIITDPTIISRGFIYMKGNEALTDSLVKDTKEFIAAEFVRDKLIHEHEFKSKLSDFLLDKIYEITQRKPMIIPIIRDFTFVE